MACFHTWHKYWFHHARVNVFCSELSISGPWPYYQAGLLHARREADIAFPVGPPTFNMRRDYYTHIGLVMHMYMCCEIRWPPQGHDLTTRSLSLSLLYIIHIHILDTHVCVYICTHTSAAFFLFVPFPFFLILYVSATQWPWMPQRQTSSVGRRHSFLRHWSYVSACNSWHVPAATQACFHEEAAKMYMAKVVQPKTTKCWHMGSPFAGVYQIMLHGNS